ncbi:protein-binding activity modulator [Lithospermum erythrorhizon]|uniref:Protein-binding activity modulator n=1 Tax=Lithospermum erythrorhizon TaxID=34254 RepID=A0AAV3PB92_LITER
MACSSQALAKCYSINGASLLPLPYSTPRPISATPKAHKFQPFNLSFTPKLKYMDAFILPRIKAQTSPDYLPDATFYKVEAILSLVTLTIHETSESTRLLVSTVAALLKIGIRGVTISEVKGFGAQGGLTERQAGSEFSEDNFVAKVKMEIVVSKDQVEAVIDKIIEEARTGEIGDGKIFVIPVSDIIRVRTGERGEKAERMVGGRAEMSSVSPN